MIGVRTKSAGGWLVTETLVSMAILGVLMAALAMARSRTAEFNDYHMVRQRCLAAARAQLDSLAAAGRPIGDGDVRRLWPGVRVRVARADGAGDWAGLKRIEATAAARSRRRKVEVALCRYLPAGEGGKP